MRISEEFKDFFGDIRTRAMENWPCLAMFAMCITFGVISQNPYTHLLAGHMLLATFYYPYLTVKKY